MQLSQNIPADGRFPRTHAAMFSAATKEKPGIKSNKNTLAEKSVKKQ